MGAGVGLLKSVMSLSALFSGQIYRNDVPIREFIHRIKNTGDRPWLSKGLPEEEAYKIGYGLPLRKNRTRFSWISDLWHLAKTLHPEIGMILK
jgi:hypothetical protein